MKRLMSALLLLVAGAACATLPGSGSISLAQVLAELQVANPSRAYPLSLTDSDVRALAGVPSGNIVLPTDFYGKSSFAITNPFTAINKTKAGTGPQTMTVTVNTDGTITYTASSTGSGSTSWGAPTTSGIGSLYWVRFTLTSGDALSSNGASTWTQLSTGRSFARQASLSGDSFSSTVTIELATDSGGANVVATWTGNVITANRTS